MAKVKPNIILLGAQGSGKSTQAELLAKNFDYEWIVTGKLVRNAIKKNDANSKIIKKYVDAGKLVPNEIIFKNIYEPHLEKVNKNKGIIFDGMPRNISQMHTFHSLLEKLDISEPILVHIYIPDKIVFERILSRKICPKCDKAYKPTDTEYNDNICSQCNIKLVSRSDDTNKNALKKRLSIFHNETKKIIEYYKNKNRFIKIDGCPSVEKVYKSISDQIKKYIDDSKK